MVCLLDLPLLQILHQSITNISSCPAAAVCVAELYVYSCMCLGTTALEDAIISGLDKLQSSVSYLYSETLGCLEFFTLPHKFWPNGSQRNGFHRVV